MLQAMVHGRLTREEEGLEDLLTSNTFGLMKYIPYDLVLLPFLSLARDPFSKHLLADWLEDVVAVDHWYFWPRLGHLGCIPCEPDVDIMFRHQDGSKTWLLIEAKYLSGKSSLASDIDMPPNDQLAREFDNLKSISQQKGIIRYALVYLTTDYTCPEKELQQSADEYEQKRGSSPNIYWLSWRMLYDVLESADYSDSDIVIDLKRLLLNFNLTMFRRLRFPELRRPEWSFERIPKFWGWSIIRPKWLFKRRELSWTWAPLPKRGEWYFPK